MLRYRLPHPLSTTARLELASRHRTQPWADGVLLMGNSCVLGPNLRNHVVCRDWSEDVVLYRQADRLTPEPSVSRFISQRLALK